ncbi:hypothetical protein MMC13_002387 [Lambiella insularis]|nr:hypothetical protein [Lambiella insularis]
MSSSLVLRLPELLLEILEHLERDNASLRSASLVNRTWFEQASSVLWRHAYIGNLANVEPSRCQFYANKLFYYHFSIINCPFLCRDDLRSLRFPRLKRYYGHADDITVPTHQQAECVSQCLEPGLEELSLFSGGLADAIWDRLASCCPRLRSLHLNDAATNQSADRFLVVLRECRHLVCLKIAGNTNTMVSDDTLRYLVSRQNLECLELGRLIQRSALEKVIDSTAPPLFAKLKRLSMRLESRAVQHVTNLLTSVETFRGLHLFIVDDQTSIPVLRHIASIKQLRSLEVRYTHSQTLPREEILSLQTLHELEKLDLSTTQSNVGLQSLTIGDDDIEQLTSQLNQLSRFIFYLRCPMSIKSIRSIGRNCPSIEMLLLYARCDLRALETIEKPLFPELKYLGLGSAREDHGPLVTEEYVYRRSHCTGAKKTPNG